MSSASGLILSTTGGHIIINSQSQTENAVSSLLGSSFEILPQTYTNSGSLTIVTNFVFNSIQQNVFDSTLTPTTITNISNVYIGPAPIAVNTNTNLVNSYSLLVDGLSKFGALNVASNAAFNSISASSATLTGQITATSISASNVTATSLTVTAPFNISNLSTTTLVVSGPATFQGPASLSATTIGGLAVSSGSQFTGQITATSISASNVSATSLTVTAPLNVSNISTTTLIVNGPATFDGSSLFSGSLTATSNATFNSISATSTVVSGPLLVSGNATFSSSLSSTSVVISGPLLTSGNATFSSSLSATSISVNTLVVNSSGGLYVNSSEIYFTTLSIGSGNTLAIDASGKIIDSVSLRRYKENEVEVNASDYVVDDVLLLKPKYFTWKHTQERDLGLIVDDALENNLTQFIYFDENGPKNFKDRSLISGILAYIKKINKRINRINEKINFT
jgi:hypothetical protein